MNATVEVVCYKSKVLANNESPLMLRVTKDRKRKYSSIGISVNPVYWDFEKNKPRRNCPDKTRIEQIIAEQIRKYREQILDFQAEDKEFTPASLHDRVNNQATGLKSPSSILRTARLTFMPIWAVIKSSRSKTMPPKPTSRP